ncbi:MAG: OmpH family outer membrane protein [Rickettsiaceae bacterium]|jgi:Skp family chaperone for outer membrane proteins|nr:OmpH family outer membrane protein [Rickettsiaceae bacterium]
MKCLRWIFLVLIIAPSVSLAQENKFVAKAAVVDVESILEHSLAIKHVKKSINEISDKIQRELTEKEINIKSIEAELIKQRGVLSEEKFNLKVLEFNKKVSQTQKEMQSKKNALEEAHSEAIAQVHKSTIEVITELAKQYGFNIVLPSSQVLFVESDMNITLQVITKLNERLSTVDVLYSPK